MKTLKHIRAFALGLGVLAATMVPAFATFQMSAAVRNARCNAIATTIGATAHILIYTGSEPANAAAAATGTKLVEITAATTWMTSASGGACGLANLPLTTTGLATGTAGYYRITASDGTTTGIQGSVTATGGGGDLTLDNTSIATSQTVNVTSYTLTEGGA